MEKSFMRKNINIILSTILLLYMGIVYMFSLRYSAFSFIYLNTILISSILIGGVLSLFGVVLDIHELDKNKEGNGSNLMQIMFAGMLIMMNVFLIYINFR